MAIINSYAKFAKYSLVGAWGVFFLMMLILIICNVFGIAGRVTSSLSVLCAALGMPLLITIQYFYDVVEKISVDLHITFGNEVSERIAPLAVHLDDEVRIGSYPSDEANAFAISSVFGGKALIAFSSSLLEAANDQQLMAIAAHEIAHLKNGDSKNKTYILAFSHAVRIYPQLLSELSKNVLKSIAIVFAGMAAIIVLVVIIFPEISKELKSVPSALRGFLPMLAWPAGVILAYFSLNHALNRAFFAYSREREFVADADGALMTSYQDMMSALSLLAENEAGTISVFDTHPALEERQKRLNLLNARA